MSKYQFITTDQPVGRFYITRISANKLIPIAQSKERSPYNSTGIQRKLDTRRVNEIAKYCESPMAMFPTPIILSGKSNYFKFYRTDNDFVESEENYNDLNSGFIKIDSEKIMKDRNFLSIVDGQHRLAGIAKSKYSDQFDLLVMFIFDTENYEDAEIFSVINRNQKQVSKSLVYDLYGLSDEMTVEKFAHEIVKALNTLDISKLKNRIKMLGYKTDNFNQYVSQGTLVDKLIPMISKNPVSDNLDLRNGNILSDGGEDQVLRKYLIRDNLTIAKIQLVTFFNAWLTILKEKNFDNTIMQKTVGFISALNVYKRLYVDEYDGFPLDNYAYLDDSQQVIEQLEQKIYNKLSNLYFNDIDISKISSSLTGVNYIEETLFKNQSLT